MTQKTSRRAVLAGAILGGAGVAAPALVSPASAQAPRTLRMVTSWPKNLPGPGVTAERLAKRIEIATGGRIAVRIFAAGELVPATAVFDAVAEGTADMAHTAALFWQGKMRAAPFFTAVPFGLTAGEHAAWIYHGGGQALWDALYAPFGVKPLMAGNTGMQMGGWFKAPITSLDDLKGLKIRMPGLGGEVMRQLGATPVTLAPSEIAPALQSGLIDATEFLGPWSDLGLGLYKVAKTYVWPGFHEPNGTGEALFARGLWDELSDKDRFAIETACAAEDAISRAEADYENARALKRLVDEYGVTLAAYPDDVLKAARDAAERVLDRFLEGSEIEGRIVTSYRAHKAASSAWARVGEAAFLRARSG